MLLHIPVCYIVTVAYLLIFFALIVKIDKIKLHLFCSGWGLAFIIALLASLAEYFGRGGVCPVSGGASLREGELTSGIPLCYISLLLLVVISILFHKTNRLSA